VGGPAQRFPRDAEEGRGVEEPFPIALVARERERDDAAGLLDYLVAR